MTDKMVSCILDKTNAEIDYDLKIEKDGSVKISRVVDAKTLDLQESAIVQACIDAAREAGIHELILMDKQFVLEALVEKIEREKRGHINTMTGNEFQKHALRTAGTMNMMDMLINGVMGLAGESGECVDLVKKLLFQGHELVKERLAKELGDVAWYLAVTAHAIDYPLDKILQMNIDKLMERYPDGFDPERSRNRKEGDV